MPTPNEPTTLINARDSYERALDVTRRQRAAKVKAWRLANPSASFLDVQKYEKRLAAEDDVRLASAESDFRREKSDFDSIQRGFDPRTGNRLVDLWGTSIIAPNAALTAAVRQNAPGTRTVDEGKFHREGKVEDWGIGGYNSDPNRRIRPAGAAARLAHDKANTQPIYEQLQRKAAEDAFAFEQVKSASKKEWGHAMRRREEGRQYAEFQANKTNHIPNINIFKPNIFKPDIFKPNKLKSPNTTSDFAPTQSLNSIEDYRSAYLFDPTQTKMKKQARPLTQ